MGLTPKQKAILDFIGFFIKKKGYAPSYREIADHFKLKSSATVHQYISTLVAKGYLDKNTSAPRSLNLKQPGEKFSGYIELPLVGLITAGQPIEALEERETIAVPQDLVTSLNCFVLKVRGQSMIEDGILDGDLVIVERSYYPSDGDIVVALIDNTYATLKRYYRDKGRIRLQPANSSMRPIFVKNPAIQGIVRGIFRKFNAAQAEA